MTSLEGVGRTTIRAAELETLVLLSSRSSPLLTLVNGLLMAWRSWPALALGLPWAGFGTCQSGQRERPYNSVSARVGAALTVHGLKSMGQRPHVTSGRRWHAACLDLLKGEVHWL
jgi:hypothetical protein